MAAPMVQVSHGKYQAVIANYPNGRLKRNASHLIKHAWYRHKDQHDERKKHREILHAETDRLDYKGSVTRRKGTNMLEHYIGCLDKKTGKIKVIETTTFQMVPKLPGADKPKEKTPGKADFGSLSFAEKNDMIISAFGSSKRKRAMESRKKNVIAGSVLEAAIGTALDQSQNESKNKSLLDVSGSTPTSKDPADFIPPHDKDATTPQQVYKIDDIISRQEMVAIQNCIAPFVNATHEDLKKWKEDETYGTYIVNHLATLPLREEPRKRKASHLMYFHYMLTFFHMRVREIRRRDPLPAEWPEVIKKRLLDEFSVKVGGDGTGTKPTRMVPSRLKDKLLSYMIILCLHMDEFMMEYEDLRNDTKVGVSRFLNHMRALGLEVASSSMMVRGEKKQIKTVSLPLPLKFPDPKTGKGKGGSR